MSLSSVIHSVLTNHSETRTTLPVCPDFCLDLEENLSVIFSFKNDIVTIICDKFTSTNQSTGASHTQRFTVMIYALNNFLKKVILRDNTL